MPSHDVNSLIAYLCVHVHAIAYISLNPMLTRQQDSVDYQRSKCYFPGKQSLSPIGIEVLYSSTTEHIGIKAHRK